MTDGVEQLTPEQCWALMRTTSVGRLAVWVEDHPDIFPVNFVVHEGTIVIRTEAGTKLAAATMMSSVAFEVDEVDADTHQGWSVVVKGHGHEPRTVEDVLDLEKLDLVPWVDAPKSRWLVVTPTETTGRRIR